jgi:hypothetical protein
MMRADDNERNIFILIQKVGEKERHVKVNVYMKINLERVKVEGGESSVCNFIKNI